MDIDAGMQAAIDEMNKGLAEGGIPIGSALVRDGAVIAAGHNKRVQDGDPITHAEIDCLRNAGRPGAGGFRNATLYSTLMPCYLCSGAAVQFGIKRVIVCAATGSKSSTSTCPYASRRWHASSGSSPRSGTRISANNLPSEWGAAAFFRLLSTKAAIRLEPELCGQSTL
jgi:tRNA(Arg) A34 adenosine deaminase TadA